VIVDESQAGRHATLTTTSPFAVAGWGTALPERRVTNAELAERIDTSDEWVATRKGIRERRVAGSDDSTGTLALAAAGRALADAVVRPAEPVKFIPSPSAAARSQVREVLSDSQIAPVDHLCARRPYARLS
jgi:hypothetical protein